MGRIVIAIVFVIAVAAQSALLDLTPDGIRLPVAAVQLSRLTEFTEFDNADHHLFSLGLSIVRAAAALERFEQTVFLQKLHRTQHSDSAGVPLYERYAVWRI